MRKIFIVLLTSMAIILNGCASSTIVSSEPSGATLYIDGSKVGKTPYPYSDTKIVGSNTRLKLKKEGYEDLHVILNRSEQVNIGAIIGGIFLLVPFMWTMEYIPQHTYELEKTSE